MRTLKYYLVAILLGAAVTVGLSSCSEEKLGETIFTETDELNPESYSYKLDKWLFENYKKVYNVDFRYRMQDVGTNMQYNLVPATYANSIDMAVLTKHLWFDAYNEVAEEGIDFLKAHGPRIIHLIGSPAYNPSTGTRILGLAEGGIKVSLYQINQMRVNDFEQLNEDYFKTMHHEFSHILHQTKTYPTIFNTFSVGHYDGNNWQDRQEGVVASLGFVSPYASSATREDFAETMANYIVKTDKQWAAIMDLAKRGWGTNAAEDDNNAIYYCYYYSKNNQPGDSNKVYIPEAQIGFKSSTDSTLVLPGQFQFAVEPFRNDTIWDDDDPTKIKEIYQVDRDNFRVGDRSGSNYFALDSKKQKIPIYVYPAEDKDGVDGPTVILQKVEVIRQWLKASWGVDLDKLREVVQRRQSTYDITELRKQVTELQ